MHPETKGKISQAVPNFLKHYYFHLKQPIFLIAHTYKNAGGNSKFNITKLNAWKLTFWKQMVKAKDDIKISVILVKKYDVNVKNFIILISFSRN